VDGLVAVESTRIGIALIGALGELVEAAKESKNPGLQEVLQKLRVEAVKLIRSMDYTLEEMLREFKYFGVDLQMPLEAAERNIYGWTLPKRMALRRLTRQLWKLSTAIKDFYADMESIFIGAQQQEALSRSVRTAYELRKDLNDKMMNNAPVAEVIKALRKPIYDTLGKLEV
jgi:hypothetical protein